MVIIPNSALFKWAAYPNFIKKSSHFFGYFRVVLLAP
jgi:hypothetical protein